MSSSQKSLQLFRLKKALKTLSSKEGRGTEMVSLYVPPGKQISEVIFMLKQEYGTASNIKSNTTRKNVQDAITRTSQRLKMFKKVPENGLVIFCGAIPQNGPGSERIETYVLTPTEPIKIYLYRCDSRFHTEHLEELLKEKETYGILVMDSSGATYASLHGRRLEIIKELTSDIPGKHRAGGQSAGRFQRLREAKVQEFYKRVAEHANEVFLRLPDLKGIILAGPGPTKLDFEKGGYLHYTLNDKIVSTLDTSYIGEAGIKEVLERSPEILRNIRYVEEKRIVQSFLYEVGHDTGLATYGEEEVLRSLRAGAVKTLLLSEALDTVRVTVTCTACSYTTQENMKSRERLAFNQSLIDKPCPKCNAPALQVAEERDLLEDFAEMAEQAGSDVEVISTETEEGNMLKNSFGGVAAILRFKPSS